MGPVVISVQVDAIESIILLNIEACMVLNAREQDPTDGRVQPRRRVSAWDEDTFTTLAALIPLDGDPMSGILGGKPEERGARNGAVSASGGSGRCPPYRPRR